MILLPGQQPPPSNKKPIYARSGWEIPQGDPPLLKPKKLLINAEEWAKWRPTIVRRTVGWHYNCVGMIFAARRAWLELDHLYDIFSHDSYRRISRREVIEGDVVVYKNNQNLTHVALIMQVVSVGETNNIRVLSKWGLDPEFIHFMEDVPDFMGQADEFWTDRAIL
jgi:hypothetical protein